MAEDVLGCKGKFHMHTSRISNFIMFLFLLTCTYRHRKLKKVVKYKNRSRNFKNNLNKNTFCQFNPNISLSTLTAYFYKS